MSGREFLDIEQGVRVLVVLGGSQGAAQLVRHLAAVRTTLPK